MLIKKNNLYFLFIIISVLIPLTNVLEKNLKSKSIGTNDILFVFFLLVFLYFGIFYLVKFFTRSSDRNKYDRILTITSCLFYFTFFYGVINKIFYKFFPLLLLDRLFIEILIFIIWSFLMVSSYYLLSFLYNRNLKLTIIIIFIMIFLINVLSISKFYIFDDKAFNKQKLSESSSNIYSENKINQLTFNKFNNVYFLIFDSYTNYEYFSYLYPNDKYEINRYLKEKNFITTHDKLSHYNSTQKSIPVILNSNYFDNKYWLSEIDWDSVRIKSLNDSMIKKIFENNDYEINSLFCGFDYYNKKKFCENISDLSYIEKFDFNFITAVFHNSPFKYFTPKFSNMINNANKIFLKNYNDIIKIIHSKSNNKPMFNFIHFGPPHPPYIFDKDCNFKRVSNNKITYNNALINDPTFLKDGYYDNFICSTNVSKKIIQNILDYDQDSYIILLSDHGPSIQKDLTPDTIDYLDIMDKHAANMSLLVDVECKENINIKDISHVNIFRIITNCLSYEKNKILPFVLYFNNYWQRKGQVEILNEKALIKIKNKKN